MWHNWARKDLVPYDNIEELRYRKGAFEAHQAYQAASQAEVLRL